MEIPFISGQPVTGQHFTDREKETAHLVANFTYGQNTIIISPRRWGKTSLVRQAVEKIGDNKIKAIFIDAFSFRDEYDFCNALSTAIIKQTSTKVEEWVGNALKLFSNLAPKFSFGVDPTTDFSISLDLKQRSQNIEEILDLPEKMAKEKGLRLVVCIDEFQQIGEFKDSVRFQKLIRGKWQLHENVSYCFFGSKHHSMMRLFQNQSMPFYRFGDILNLQKIPVENWVKFIMERFNVSGKSISPQQAQTIAETVQCDSGYVQQLAWFNWLTTPHEVTDQSMNEALESLINQNGALFEKTVQDLTGPQLAYLQAMVCGVTSGFSSSQVLSQYNLGTSANASYIQKVLIDKEIIDVKDGKVFFLDPLLPVWLRRRLFPKNQP